MKLKDVVKRAAALHLAVEKGQRAAAELDALVPQLRKVLASREGNVIHEFTSDGMRSYLVVGGELTPYKMPTELYASDLEDVEVCAGGEADDAGTGDEEAELAEVAETVPV